MTPDELFVALQPGPSHKTHYGLCRVAYRFYATGLDVWKTPTQWQESCTDIYAYQLKSTNRLLEFSRMHLHQFGFTFRVDNRVRPYKHCLSRCEATYHNPFDMLTQAVDNIESYSAPVSPHQPKHIAIPDRLHEQYLQQSRELREARIVYACNFFTSEITDSTLHPHICESIRSYAMSIEFIVTQMNAVTLASLWRIQDNTPPYTQLSSALEQLHNIHKEKLKLVAIVQHQTPAPNRRILAFLADCYVDPYTLCDLAQMERVFYGTLTDRTWLHTVIQQYYQYEAGYFFVVGETQDSITVPAKASYKAALYYRNDERLATYDPIVVHSSGRM